MVNLYYGKSPFFEWENSRTAKGYFYSNPKRQGHGQWKDGNPGGDPEAKDEQNAMAILMGIHWETDWIS